MHAPMTPTRCELAVFVAGGKAWTIGHVLAHAGNREPAQAATDPLPSTTGAHSLDSELTRFRSARDLLSAAECEHWLGLRGLAYADLQASLQRRLAGLPATDGEQSEIDRLLQPSFDTQARELAWRVALALHVGAPLAQAEAMDFTSLDAGFAAERERVLDATARRHALRALQGRLGTVEFEVVEFDRADAALEGWCCVHDDKQDLAELALREGYPFSRRCTRVGKLPEAWAKRLRTAAPGRLLAPFEDRGRHLLLRPLALLPARLDDPVVLAAIDQRICAQHFGELALRHLRWVLAPHDAMPDAPSTESTGC